MLGFLGIFGRSRELQQLEGALRAVGLHPRLVSNAVKIAALKLVKEASGGSSVPPHAYRAAAEMLGYCMLGPRGFASANDPRLREAVETRLEAALGDGDSLDARLVLLALHSGTIQGEVVERYRLEADQSRHAD